MFDSYLKGIYGVCVYGWSESYNTNFDNDEEGGFFFQFYKTETSY